MCVFLFQRYNETNLYWLFETCVKGTVSMKEHLIYIYHIIIPVFRLPSNPYGIRVFAKVGGQIVDYADK